MSGARLKHWPIHTEEQRQWICRQLMQRRIVDNSGCWLWQGTHRGHPGEERPYLLLGTRNIWPVHRIVAILFLGLKPKSPLQVLHKCDNTYCWNPRHLYVGTQAQNVRDTILRERRKLKLTHAQVAEIRASPESQQKLAVRFGVSRSMVGKIKRNQTRVAA